MERGLMYNVTYRKNCKYTIWRHVNMFENLVEKLKKNPTTLVFTEGPDPRILEAASRLKKEGILEPLLVGNPEEVQAAAAKGGFDITDIRIVDPANYRRMDELVDKMVELRKGKMTPDECKAALLKGNYFGTMLVKMGVADCLLGGANYTTAVCKLDDQGRLVAIQFTGGTSTVEGILSNYTRASTSSTSATVQLIGFDGVTRTYTVPSGATTTVDGLVDALSTSLKDSYVVLRLLDEDSSVQSVSVDTKSNYVQGVIKSVDSSDSTITITRLSNNRTATYDVTSSAVITYNGKTTRLRDLDKNDFVTILLNESDDATMIQAYPSSTTAEGTISERTFGSGTDTTITFVITQKDGTKASFKVDLSDPPTVERDEEDSTVDKLRVGDVVEFTIRYGAVTRIKATTQNVNLTGTVERIIQEKSGYTLEMLLSDGEKVSYTVDSTISVTQNNKEVALSSLKPGYKLGLAVNGDQVVAIEIQQAVNSGNKVSGTILYVDYAEDIIYLRAATDTGGEDIVTVSVPSSAVILNASTGKSLVLRDLDSGNIIEVNGSYSGTIFQATVILRQ